MGQANPWWRRSTTTLCEVEPKTRTRKSNSNLHLIKMQGSSWVSLLQKRGKMLQSPQVRTCGLQLEIPGPREGLQNNLPTPAKSKKAVSNWVRPKRLSAQSVFPPTSETKKHYQILPPTLSLDQSHDPRAESLLQAIKCNTPRMRTESKGRLSTLMAMSLDNQRALFTKMTWFTQRAGLS